MLPDRRPDLKLDTLHISLWNGTIGVGRGWPVILPNPSHLNVPGNLVQLRHSHQLAGRGQTVLQAGTELEKDTGGDRLTSRQTLRDTETDTERPRQTLRDIRDRN